MICHCRFCKGWQQKIVCVGGLAWEMSKGSCLGGVSRQPDVGKRHLGRGDEGWRRPRPPEVLSPGISVVSVPKRER